MNTTRTSQKFNSNRGTILFIVLIFVIVISIIVLSSYLRSVSEIEFLGNEFSKLKAYYSCFSGNQFASNRILTSSKNRIELLDLFHKKYNPRLLLDGTEIFLSLFDIVDEEYYDLIPEQILQQIGEQKFKLYFQDSAGLINFFRIRKDLFLNFLENHQIDREQAQIIIDSVMDWMDADDFPRYNGAEKGFYLDNNLVIPPNRLIYSAEELLLIRGINRDIFHKIGNVIDFTIQNRGLNPNTVPENIFHFLFGLQDEKIDNIIKKRRSREFENLAVFSQLSNHNFSNYPNTFQFFTSDVVYVTISAHMSESREYFLKLKLFHSGRKKSSGFSSFKGGFRGSSIGSGKGILSDMLYIQNWDEGTRTPR